MKEFIKVIGILAGLVMTFNSTVYAGADVDFSKAYIIPDKSGIDKVTIGGVKPLWSDLFYSVDFNLNTDYNLQLSGALDQSTIQEQLEQNLRNTTWKGTYVIFGSTYTTTMNLVVVQDGYVGGEVTHEPTDTNTDRLRARVTGDIITQFKIDDVFTDEDRISPSVLDSLPVTTPTRQLVRIKRVRALSFNGNWSTNREYRMTLENSVLTGIVGIPNNTYGSSDGTSSNGDISLALTN